MPEPITDYPRWACELCGWIYDPNAGDPDGGIDPGTPFEEIPDNWTCPVCGARTEDFILVPAGEELPNWAID